MRAGLRSGWSQVATDNPVVFFYLFRFITWVLAVTVLFTGIAPASNSRFGEGLALYTLFHLLLATGYTIFVHPRFRGTSARVHHSKAPIDLLVVGFADVLASLVVVFYSGGWGSPYWHFAITSILVPCFLVKFWKAMVVATVFVGLYMPTVVFGGQGLDGPWLNTELHLFVGFIFTAYLVAMAVSYLGHIFIVLDEEKRRATIALDDLETLFEVTRNVISSSDDLQALLQQVTQTVRVKPQFSAFSIYLWQPEDSSLHLATTSVGVEELPDGVVLESGEGLVGRAASRRTTQLTDSDSVSWRAAIPLQSGEALHGVMELSVAEPAYDGDRARNLGQALANQISIGIQNANLYQQQLELAAQEERNRIARDIHDGVAQSMYALSLSIETSADIAERDKNPLREQLKSLVPLVKNTLLETRHYIYDLKPLLSGETDLKAVAENQVKEFQMVAGIPTTLTVEGEPHRVAVAAETGFYRILQEALANVLKHAHASEVAVELTFEKDSVHMSVKDNGIGFDKDNIQPGYGLDNIRHRVEELNGSVEITSVFGRGTTVKVVLPVKEVEREPR